MKRSSPLSSAEIWSGGIWRGPTKELNATIVVCQNNWLEPSGTLLYTELSLFIHLDKNQMLFFGSDIGIIGAKWIGTSRRVLGELCVYVCGSIMASLGAEKGA